MAISVITAYRELALMVIERFEQNTAYGDLHTANPATLKDPTTHIEGSSVPSIVVPAECVRLAQWTRAVFNKRGDEMISDLKLQSSRAQHPTWFLLGRRANLYLKMFSQSRAMMIWHQFEERCTSSSICCGRRSDMHIRINAAKRVTSKALR
jgi:hypothetical protein